MKGASEKLADKKAKGLVGAALAKARKTVFETAASSRAQGGNVCHVRCLEIFAALSLGPLRNTLDEAAFTEVRQQLSKTVAHQVVWGVLPEPPEMPSQMPYRDPVAEFAGPPAEAPAAFTAEDVLRARALAEAGEAEAPAAP